MGEIILSRCEPIDSGIKTLENCTDSELITELAKRFPYNYTLIIWNLQSEEGFRTVNNNGIDIYL